MGDCLLFLIFLKEIPCSHLPYKSQKDSNINNPPAGSWGNGKGQKALCLISSSCTGRRIRGPRFGAAQGRSRGLCSEQRLQSWTNTTWAQTTKFGRSTVVAHYGSGWFGTRVLDMDPISNGKWKEPSSKSEGSSALQTNPSWCPHSPAPSGPTSRAQPCTRALPHTYIGGHTHTDVPENYSWKKNVKSMIVALMKSLMHIRHVRIVFNNHTFPSFPWDSRGT